MEYFYKIINFPLEFSKLVKHKCVRKKDIKINYVENY